MKRIGLAQQVAEAQAAIHDKIREALQGFTDAPVLVSYRVTWLVATALDERGNVKATTYYHFDSDMIA